MHLILPATKKGFCLSLYFFNIENQKTQIDLRKIFNLMRAFNKYPEKNSKCYSFI